MAEPFWTRHRGPYILVLNRDTPKQKMKWHTEALKDELPGDEALELATTFANDPRDPVQFVHIYSVSEECYIHTVRRQQ